MKRSPMKRRAAPLRKGDARLKRTPLARGRWSRASWEQWDRLDAQAHAAWKRKVTRGRCAVCAALGKPDAHPVRDPHHVLPARYIRRYVRSLKLPADEARRLLRSLLYDPRNGLCLDRRCHDKHETGFKRVTRDVLPAKAWQFARELGLEYALDRLYPLDSGVERR